MIVLDTHAWVWWVSDPGKLGRRARREIERSPRIGVPTICSLEIAIGVSREIGRASCRERVYVLV